MVCLCAYHGGLRSMPNSSTILQLKAWQNCDGTLDLENSAESTLSAIYRPSLETV